MRRSALSLALFWTGGLAWWSAVLFPALAAGALEPASQTMLVAGLTLSGQWTILWSHIAYARHVVLDAHGLLAPRTATTRPRLAKRTRKVATAQATPADAAIAESSTRGTTAVGRRAAAETASAERQASDSAPAKVAAVSKPAVASGAAAAAKTAPTAKPASPAGVRLGVHADDDSDDASDRDLSRAERKRLKRQQRGQVRNAA